MQDYTRFNRPGVVSVGAGEGGLTRVLVTTSAAEAEIYLHGATVTRFQPRGQKPVLFLSPRTIYDKTKAIRGGIPVIFPWFGPHATDKSAPQHGYVRMAAWELEHVEAGADAVLVRLGLKVQATVAGGEHHDVTLRFDVSVSSVLDVALTARNNASRTLRCEDALHTYLTVADVRKVEIKGLGGLTYIDKMDENRRKTEGSAPIKLAGPTDRVYLGATGTVTVEDPGLGRVITVEKEGSASTVVWNPWDSGAAKLKDLGEDAWSGMVCVEAANAADNAVEIGAGKEHTTRTRLRV